MYIIQMADLHVGAKKQDFDRMENILSSSIEIVQRQIPEKSKVLLCICGDVIDSKGLNAENRDKCMKRYCLAEKLITGYVEQLRKHFDIQIRLCVGNHDITHMTEFEQFAAICDRDFSTTELEKCYQDKITEDGVVCIYVNSCLNNGYEIGGIDYVHLEELLKGEKKETRKIIVMHHTVMSMYEDDSSSIRNAAQLVLLADQYNVIAILHGHIHGENILNIGQSQCKIIGVGALFTRENPDVNSQFNVIEINEEGIKQVSNCRYNADDRSEPWSTKKQFEAPKHKENYIFDGMSFQECYEKLLREVDKNGALNNIRLEIKNDYGSFHKALHEYLEQDTVNIGEQKYDYFSLAKKWEADKLPPELYFNHGACFYVNNQSGIDYVADQLKKKPTSNRIVLAAYNMENVIASLDDKEYLPSLESIQFGIRNVDTLMVHMQLRALEICRFLKINICEIDFILEELKKQEVRFEKVDIVVSAFRAQKREKFHCFLKAEIDTMKKSELDAKVMTGKIEYLCKLLKEKQDATETINRKEGLERLYEAMLAYNKEVASKKYSEEVLEKMQKLLEIYDRLDDIHQRRSVCEDAEKECEQNIGTLIGDIIHILKEGEEA